MGINTSYLKAIMFVYRWLMNNEIQHYPFVAAKIERKYLLIDEK